MNDKFNHKRSLLDDEKIYRTNHTFFYIFQHKQVYFNRELFICPELYQSLFTFRYERDKEHE